MKDRLGRKIDYLRISVTDKCNLRCRYCMPTEGIPPVTHEELLTLEEIFRVVMVMQDLGIRAVRITGGEPLVRKNVVKLISDIHTNCHEIEEISMTTNGVLLGDQMDELQRAGLQGVNISLDTVNPQEYLQITGRADYAKVEASVRKALDYKMKVKLNCVAIRQLNEESLIKVADLARENPVDVRFIELMPLGCGKLYEGIPAEEIRRRLEAVYGKAADCDYKSRGPAQYYDFKGFQGKIGFISPISQGFCRECNRIRLTLEGRLKLCLHYDYGIDLRPLLRNGLPDEEIKEVIKSAIWEKPVGHEFYSSKNCLQENCENRNMVQIGG